MTTSSVLTLASYQQRLTQAGIALNVQTKQVKNINFRLYPYRLNVSVPARLPKQRMVQVLYQRLDWVLAQHQQLLLEQSNSIPLPTQQPRSWHLWGELQPTVLGLNDIQTQYRRALHQQMPSLFAKWQPEVGAYAKHTRIKAMRTRWGSCNVNDQRVWLSVYLPAYPLRCTEYVIVHELYHLHHANHSAAFWQTVAQAMPDYRQWHQLLRSKAHTLDG